MEKEKEKLTKELISDPSLWRMSLELDKNALELVIFSLAQENSLIHRRLVLDSSKSLQSALEDAVYDNPLLLSDFGKVDFLIDTKRFMLIPDSLKDEDTREDICSTLWPDYSLSMLSNTLAGLDSTLVFEEESSLLSFIRRTFPTVRIQHRLTPIITYFHNKDRLSNASKMYVNLREDYTDIIYFQNGELRVVNTFSTATPTDVIYYIMATVKITDFATNNDEIMLSGNPNLREPVAQTLRKYVNYVMPVVFPSAMFHAGKDATQVPFELILIPLCE